MHTTYSEMGTPRSMLSLGSSFWATPMPPAAPKAGKQGVPGLSSPSIGSDALSLLLASPTPFRARKPKAAAKKPKSQGENKVEGLGPSIPQKRQRLDIEPEAFEFRANCSTNSFFGSPRATNTGSSPSIGTMDLKKMVQEAISPLVGEIRGLKNEVQQLRAERAQIAISTASRLPTHTAPPTQAKATEKAVKPRQQKTPSTVMSKDIASKTTTERLIPAQKPTYAGILRKEAALQAYPLCHWEASFAGVRLPSPCRSSNTKIQSRAVRDLVMFI